MLADVTRRVLAAAHVEVHNVDGDLIAYYCGCTVACWRMLVTKNRAQADAT